MHFAVTVYYTIISKFQKLEKYSKYSDHKKEHKPGEWYHTDVCMQFKNYLIKAVG